MFPALVQASQLYFIPGVSCNWLFTFLTNPQTHMKTKSWTACIYYRVNNIIQTASIKYNTYCYIYIYIHTCILILLRCRNGNDDRHGRPTHWHDHGHERPTHWHVTVTSPARRSETFRWNENLNQRRLYPQDTQDSPSGRHLGGPRKSYRDM